MAYKLENKIVKYLPEYLHDVREYVLIDNAIEYELSKIATGSKYTEDQFTYPNMSEYTLAMYEKSLGVKKIAEATIEERKRTIVSVYNSYPPFTKKWLINKIDYILGSGNYEVYFSVKERLIFVSVDYIAIQNIPLLKRFLEATTPLNFVYSIAVLMADPLQLSIGAKLVRETNIEFKVVN